MAQSDGAKPTRDREGITRREFIYVSGLTAVGLTFPQHSCTRELEATPRDKDVNCIQLMLVGGPSQLDTWDMKPSAPMEIRGPFKPIATNVDGIQISEIFPRMSKHADKFALVRSLHHEGPAVHYSGCQMMQTGRMYCGEFVPPNIGSVLSKLKGRRGDLPANVLLNPIREIGGNAPTGAAAGFLGNSYDPMVFRLGYDFTVDDLRPNLESPNSISGSRARFEQTRNQGPSTRRVCYAFDSDAMKNALDLSAENDSMLRRYGNNQFGRSCLVARRLVERGVRFVTLNMFDTVFRYPTWDTHGRDPFSPVSKLRDHVAPMFDNAYSSLLEDLSDRGLLNATLVVAGGEFGRTPRINKAGGRDHWPQCWTIALAGGGIRGGQIIGSSDATASEPKDTPVTPANIVATMYAAMGIPAQTRLGSENGQSIKLLDDNVEVISALL